MVTLAALSCICLFISPLFVAATRQSSVFSAVKRETEAERLARREIEADNFLAKVNRPYVKSFTSSYGDIIDCVRLEDQLTLDDPLMKNHTIQMRPTWEPEHEPEMMVGFGDDVDEIFHGPNDGDTNDGEGCTVGTIPILRTLKKNVLNFDPIERYGRKDPSYGLWFMRSARDIRQSRVNHIP